MTWRLKTTTDFNPNKSKSPTSGKEHRLLLRDLDTFYPEKGSETIALNHPSTDCQCRAKPYWGLGWWHHLSVFMKQIKLNSKLELHVQFSYPHRKDAQVLASVQRKTSEKSWSGWDTDFVALGQGFPLARRRWVCDLVFIGTLWIWRIINNAAILGEKCTARYYNWKPNKLKFETTQHFLAIRLLNIYHCLVC